MYENLLKPGTINTMQLRNRLTVGPMERAMANPDGTLNERYIDYMRERSIGGAALMQIESTFVDLSGRGNPFQVGCHDDIVIPALTRMADAVHEHGGKLAMELHHGGRQASPSGSGRQPMAPSPIPSDFMGPGCTPRAMTQLDIDMLIEAWAKAAQRCVRAGVDMVHLHGAHGYLLGQFLSPRSNKREDQYGGSLENRARFPLEVLAAVRAVVGQDYPIGYRISAVEFLEGGLELEDSVRFSTMLADAGIDFIDVAGGTYESFAMIFQTPLSPRGGFVDHAVAIKNAVGDRVPVGVAQRMNDPDFADAVMEEHGIDYISLTRAFHADPHFARKIEQRRASDILPCIGCNACLWMTVNRVPAGCAANPHSNFENARRMTPTQNPRHFLVVGGGVAGLQAARVLARQGNQVTLAEQSSQLGGQVALSARLQPDHAHLVSWLEGQLERHGVQVRLETQVDEEYVSTLRPDAVVVATGARPAPRRFAAEGDAVDVVDLFTALRRPDEDWSGVVAVTGADIAGCYTAIQLAQAGAEVHLIDVHAAIASDVPVPNNSMLADVIAATPGITVHTETTVEGLAANRLRIQKHGDPSELTIDSLVLGGRVSNYELAEALRSSCGAIPVYAIGDAVRPRDVYWASSEAAEIAVEAGTTSMLKVETTAVAV